jgi:hypothetical protein
LSKQFLPNHSLTRGGVKNHPANISMDTAQTFFS